eukprot:scaffold77251_cov18-Prasinocladus_malaysianus.AAC.2
MLVFTARLSQRGELHQRADLPTLQYTFCAVDSEKKQRDVPSESRTTLVMSMLGAWLSPITADQ